MAADLNSHTSYEAARFEAYLRSWHVRLAVLSVARFCFLTFGGELRQTADPVYLKGY